MSHVTHVKETWWYRAGDESPMYKYVYLGRYYVFLLLSVRN